MSTPSPSSRVLAVLADAVKPMTAYDILARLARFGVRSPPTVYRALDRLQRKGCVHRVESLNAFVACTRHGPHNHDETHDHTPHLGVLAVCTRCGEVRETDAPELQRALDKLGKTMLAAIESRVIEIKGVCPACLPKA